MVPPVYGQRCVYLVAPVSVVCAVDYYPNAESSLLTLSPTSEPAPPKGPSRTSPALRPFSGTHRWVAVGPDRITGPAQWSELETAVRGGAAPLGR